MTNCPLCKQTVYHWAPTGVCSKCQALKRSGLIAKEEEHHRKPEDHPTEHPKPDQEELPKGLLLGLKPDDLAVLLAAFMFFGYMAVWVTHWGVSKKETPAIAEVSPESINWLDLNTIHLPVKQVYLCPLCPYDQVKVTKTRPKKKRHKA